ncbi:MAG TPA: Fe(3+) ABC transporter substrate-binding protein [Porticoccaceae bacterium]|jgi:iron(III) transport system substrate-binding protein|nr:Fe(3+) ABC transporter substrate-binding protein [Porticoccaceae bacterium]
MHVNIASLIICQIIISLFLGSSKIIADEVNIYSARQESLIKPLLDKFTKDTGTTVNLVTGKGDALLTRLKSEGVNSPADVLLTVDAGRLYRAQQAGVLKPVDSDVLTLNIPSHLRSLDNQWFGLSVRARVIVFAKDRVNPVQLSTYEALSKPQWKGKICVRSSNNIYNQSLVAGMIASKGLAETEGWLKGFVENFARPPAGGDRDQIKAVAAGQCDIAVVNSYYLGRMLSSSDKSQKTAANKVSLFWPNQADRGTHINISGAAITKSTKNSKAAERLIAFLAADESQRWYAERNNEFPIRDNIQVSPVLASWGSFVADTVNMTELGQNNAEAIKAMDRAGWK